MTKHQKHIAYSSGLSSPWQKAMFSERMLHTDAYRNTEIHEILWYWYTNREYDTPALQQMYSKLIPCIIYTPVWFPHLVSTDFLMIPLTKVGVAPANSRPPQEVTETRNAKLHTETNQLETLWKMESLLITSLHGWTMFFSIILNNIKESQVQIDHYTECSSYESRWLVGPGVAKGAQSVDG